MCGFHSQLGTLVLFPCVRCLTLIDSVQLYKLIVNKEHNLWKSFWISTFDKCLECHEHMLQLQMYSQIGTKQITLIILLQIEIAYYKVNKMSVE